MYISQIYTMSILCIYDIAKIYKKSQRLFWDFLFNTLRKY